MRRPFGDDMRGFRGIFPFSSVGVLELMGSGVFLRYGLELGRENDIFIIIIFPLFCYSSLVLVGFLSVIWGRNEEN